VETPTENNHNLLFLCELQMAVIFFPFENQTRPI
jgi:hypothetical protein